MVIQDTLGMHLHPVTELQVVIIHKCTQVSTLAILAIHLVTLHLRVI